MFVKFIEFFSFLFGLIRDIPPEWVQAIASALLAGLTLLYVRELRQQSKRERTRNHIERIRDKAEIWLEHLPQESVFDVTPSPDQDLIAAAAKPRDAFQTVPDVLQGEPLFEDLVETHANDLRKKKEKIETLYEEFKGLRDKFDKEYNLKNFSLRVPFEAEAVDNLSRWMFKTLLILKRGGRDGEGIEIESLDFALDTKYEPPYVDGFYGEISTRKVIYYAYIGDIAMPVLQASVKDRNSWDENKKGLEVVQEALIGELSEVRSQPIYSIVLDAADKLDNIKSTLGELEYGLKKFVAMESLNEHCDFL